MTSKRTAASKRAPLPRAADYAKSFLKDWERLSRSGRYDMNQLKEAMLLLIANEGPSGPEWLDHPLAATGKVIASATSAGDFLLLYKLDDRATPGLLVFVRAGTHADLFE